MTTSSNLLMIEKTKQWIQSFIIKLNLCPFAKREMERGSVNIQVSSAITIEDGLIDLSTEIERLNSSALIETTLLLFPAMLQDFFDYLDFVYFAESMLLADEYEGIYQLATFHPNYCFADTLIDDVTNYTNRSPYPMLHILREESIEKAIFYYGNTEKIPENNMTLLRSMGIYEVKNLSSDDGDDKI